MPIYKFSFLICTLLSFKLEALENANTKYDLKDLDVLEREKNYQEFFAHAYDIRPSQRNKQWQKMYQNMALMLIEDKIKNEDFSLTTFNTIENMARKFPLNDDEVFLFKRNLYAQKYFKHCFYKSETKQASDSCNKELISFWENSNKDADLALNFIEYINDTQSNLKKWPFYQTVVRDQIAPLYCKRVDVVNAILQKISEETFQEGFNGNYQKILNQNIPDKCLKETYPTLKSILTSTDSNGLDKELAFSILEAKEQLSADDKEFYYTIYLFSGPVTGEKMNIAWKYVERLSESLNKREKILSRLNEVNYLSDRLFQDPNLPRSKAIINHFAKNFPEILDYYAKNCINFISGNESVKVNSLSSCHSFLKTAKNVKFESKLNWISDSIETQYSALKR